MKKLFIPIFLLIVILAIMLSGIPAAAQEFPPTITPNRTYTPTVTITPIHPFPPGPGEILYPPRSVTPTPTLTLPRTTETRVPTATHTSIPATPAGIQTTPMVPTTIVSTVPVTPTTVRTTVSATPTTVGTTRTATATRTPGTTATPTTLPVSQATTVPVETVTVYVYESSRVYYPESYYPPEYYGYGYPYSNTNYPTGSVTVTSDPSDAIVIIDGYNSGTTPHVFTGLSTGYHTVEVNYPGYEAYITQVYVEGGGNMEVAADLVPLVTYGSLFIDSTPQGADVFVDGNYEGTSPVTVGSLSEGPHQLELHLAGYEVYTSTENVVEGQAQVLNIALAPYSSSSADGSIAVTSSRPGALVYLDGVYKGSTQSGIPFNIIAVSPGSHTVLLSAPGYQDVTQAVQVYAGQVSTMNAVFIPSGTASQAQGTSGQGSGSIFVTSSPAGGQVSIDGQFRGVAPVTIYNVASGSHIVNLNSPGMTTGRVRSMSRQTRWCR